MTPTDTPASGTSRRQLIVTGAFGAAATAFLAACAGTKSDAVAGQSGLDPTTTLNAPSAPIKDASEADLAYNTTLLRTATSLELLAAEQYKKYGPVLTDADWKASAARFAVDHQAAADKFKAATTAKDRVDKPNAFLQENTIDPIADQLVSNGPILDFFAALESTIAATYIAAVGQFTTASGRADFAGFAEASARRNAVLDNTGTGGFPTSALYPLQDLIPNEAYVTVETDDKNAVAAN
ncbi:hypothetical protein [Aquihabitans sp. McL0605]|uniref:hypothetical protein n=1 Tax=Aquihabitans sp. McL0605 TaxID=3415671 RepID=UPI003CF03E42